jgi:hypothetical protein
MCFLGADGDKATMETSSADLMGEAEVGSGEKDKGGREGVCNALASAC